MPVWSRAGRELFFRAAGDSRMMVAAYETQGDSFLAGKPLVWSETAFSNFSTMSSLDIAPDGKRFAVTMASEKLGKSRNELTVLLNFFTELPPRTVARFAICSHRYALVTSLPHSRPERGGGAANSA